MSSDRPDLVRRLLDEDAPGNGSPETQPPGSRLAPPVQRSERAPIELEPEDGYNPARGPVPQRRVPPPTRHAPPGGLRRFAPSVWPWPAATPLGRLRNVAIVALAIVGAIAGLEATWYQLTANPLADVRAYFDAAVRLNHGQPLYPVASSLATGAAAVPTADAYRLPPLLAVVLRPLALLGWPAFAAAWEAMVVGSLVLLLRRLGAGAKTWLVLGILAVPAGWALAIGEVQVPLTLLLAIGQPWSIALGANLNLFTALAALWWIGRRDVQATGAFLGWLILFGLVQVAVELGGTLAFLKTLGAAEFARLLHGSPFEHAPLAWATLVGLGIIASLVWARLRWGWLTAVILTTVATLPLQPWRLIALLAAIRQPEIAGAAQEERPLQPLRYARR